MSGQRWWSVYVKGWSSEEEDWVSLFGMERGRFLFDCIENAKAEAEKVWGACEWTETPDGDWVARMPGESGARLEASWLESSPTGGRGHGSDGPIVKVK